MAAIGTELVVILLLLLTNGVFAMSEIAVVTARRVRLQQRAEDGDAGARAALRLAAEPTQFLSTVQVGITLIGVLAGAFGGATIAGELAPVLARVPWLAPRAEGVALALVVAVITYLSLVVGELVPKQIALANPERIARVVARPMRTLSRLAAPLVALLTGSTRFVLRLLRVRASVDRGITEEEIRALVEQGTESGEVQPVERRIVESAFRLGDRQVAAIMTPRPDVEWVDVSDDPAALRAGLAKGHHGQIVVCDGDLDHVIGVVLAEDLLARCLAGETLDAGTLRAALRQPLFVPESMPVYRLLELFRSSGARVAIALDEFGGLQGIATLGDILLALVGDFPEPGEEDQPRVVQRDDGTWLVDGMVPIDEIEAMFDLEDVAGDDGGYHTLAGLVLAQLGHIPVPGERFEYGGVTFEVMDMDGRRVDRVLITPRTRSAGEEDFPSDR